MAVKIKQERNMGPLILSFCAIISACLAANPCVSRNTGGETNICVCNATYCDYLDPISDGDISGTNYLHYETTMAGLRLERSTGKRGTNGNVAANSTFTVDRNTTYQEIVGFGGALTDSAALNIMKMSKSGTNNLLRAYFGEGGSNYLFVRIPIGASDFSETYYSYNDVENDMYFDNFNLTGNDFEYKLPILKAAAQLRGGDLNLIASPWSAPYWMKINGTTKGISYLNYSYYTYYAIYIAKFFQAYLLQNLKFWGVTTQNEPSQGYIYPSVIPSMGWSSLDMRLFVATSLDSVLSFYGYDYIRVMILDDSLNYMSEYVYETLADEEARPHSKGIAVHLDSVSAETLQNLTAIHNKYPEQFIFYTEACVKTILTPELMGSWAAVGEYYIKGMFQAFTNWAVGWTDWNMALNEEGGPMNVGDNYTYYGYPAAILVNSTADEFYKLSSYYVQAHFSSFIPPGSKRVQLDVSGDSSLLNIAFLTPQGSIVVVLANLNDAPAAAVVTEGTETTISVNIKERSINTIIYK